ncbi:MAG: ABC transporter ATP-binding protein [Planctomycetes bacterium]|nr:ABC transporter ATP-binding protein [Planctomycetota bacterium]
MSSPLLEIADLAVSFDADGGPVSAVDGLSLTLHRGQMLAVVGESGCGKSVTALSILGLLECPPARIDSGTILFDGRDLMSLSEKQMLQVRGGEIAMIFQEPMTSLNPVYTIGEQIVEAVMLHSPVKRRRAVELAAEALEAVGMDEPKRRLADYPHQFSGGMCQRVMIAMALACKPKLLVADEPTTALDVTIQAQILTLLETLRHDRDMAVLFITHDLAVVAENADVVCVMYAGRPVEYASVGDLLARPLHPYTRALLAAVPPVGGVGHVGGVGGPVGERLVTVEKALAEPSAFDELPGGWARGRGAVPWWPAMDPPEDFLGARGRGDSVLYEVEPDHWVGCWLTGSLARRAQRPPDIAAKRKKIAPSVRSGR